MVERITEDNNKVKERIVVDERNSRVNRIIKPYDKVRNVVNDILSNHD